MRSSFKKTTSNFIRKSNSNFLRKTTSNVIFTFEKQRMESNDSLSKMNRISEEDIIGNNNSLESEELSKEKGTIINNIFKYF